MKRIAARPSTPAIASRAVPGSGTGANNIGASSIPFTRSKNWGGPKYVGTKGVRTGAAAPGPVLGDKGLALARGGVAEQAEALQVRIPEDFGFLFRASALSTTVFVRRGIPWFPPAYFEILDGLRQPDSKRQKRST